MPRKGASAGKPGPKQKAQEFKLMRGDDRPEPTPPPALSGVRGAPLMPDVVAGDPVASAEWHSVASRVTRV